MVDEKRLEAAGIDYKIAMERFGDNEEIFEKFLYRFADNTHFTDGKKAYEQKDYDGVLKAIHALKGFSGTLAMEEVYQASSAVVDNIRKEQYDKLPQNMEWLEKEYQQPISGQLLLKKDSHLPSGSSFRKCFCQIGCKTG